jgi:hypothetical protein
MLRQLGGLIYWLDNLLYIYIYGGQYTKIITEVIIQEYNYNIFYIACLQYFQYIYINNHYFVFWLMMFFVKFLGNGSWSGSDIDGQYFATIPT